MSKSRKCKEWINITANRYTTKIYYDGYINCVRSKGPKVNFRARPQSLEYNFDNRGDYHIIEKYVDDTGL